MNDYRNRNAGNARHRDDDANRQRRLDAERQARRQASEADDPAIRRPSVRTPQADPRRTGYGNGRDARARQQGTQAQGRHASARYGAEQTRGGHTAPGAQGPRTRPRNTGTAPAGAPYSEARPRAGVQDGMHRGTAEPTRRTRSAGPAGTVSARNGNRVSGTAAGRRSQQVRGPVPSGNGAAVLPDKTAPEPSAENGFGSRSKRQYLDKVRTYASGAFVVILAGGFVLGLLLFMRPSVSQVENRQLTAFPAFTVQSFLDGDFTGGISTWYADTYPFRDKLVSANQAIKGLYGYESSTQMYGTAVQGDDIPTESGTTDAPKKEPVAPETYDSWNLEADIQGQIMQGLYVKDGAVYATYGFTQEAANDYVNAVNGAADKLDGTTKVYSILIPNNSGVLLDDDELAALGGSNQAQAIQYYYDSYSDKVTTVDTMDTLKQHNDEYLYFRTDHHWTALAAYYVYRNFCEEKGIEPHDMSQFQEEDFSPFLGSYYSQLQLDSLAADPDTVQAWVPMGTNDLTYTDASTGEQVDWNVIRDVSDWDEGTLYNCFVGGDQPWAEIHNPAITDGSSCLVVKESYGNAFIPWLVDHYETVYIADFRYTNVNVADYCKDNGVDDLILINNISIIGSVDVAGKIASIL